jgi:hypothetical protein
MDAALEREMHMLPLRALSERHFYEYNNSVKSDVQPEDEILYFLPRMLELLTQGAQLHRYWVKRSTMCLKTGSISLMRCAYIMVNVMPVAA